MNIRSLALPAFTLGGAALLFAPLRSSQAFSKIGGNLGETQRDVRVVDNFADPTSSDNVTPASQFPGYVGLQLAIWKGVVEWGSQLHGNGQGDINNNSLGSGGANFDAFWAGSTSGIGNSNTNIVSTISSCTGGTLAFTETPISDGWRIRFCENWTWDDGPGTIGNRFDIQGVMCHEYGHALGLGHSTVGQATMFPSGGAGSTAIRSIAADDIAGVQCIYGVASATKPSIVATVANAGTLTIFGSNFGATGNEIWFTPSGLTPTLSDPIVRVANVGSSAGGTIISVAIPAAAGPGDVIVNGPGVGNATVSNAFPTDLSGTFGTVPGPHPHVASVTPSTIDALIPGTDQTITLSGTDLDLSTAVLLDGGAIDPTRYTIVDATTITLDMPQASSLGAHNLGVTDGTITDAFQVTIVVPATPKLQLGTGDPLNVVDRDLGFSYILSGAVGSSQILVYSTSNLPSVNAYVSLSLGNNFASATILDTYVIPAPGWLQVTVLPGALNDPGPAGRTVFAQSVEFANPIPFDVSGLQSVHVIQ